MTTTVEETTRGQFTNDAGKTWSVRIIFRFGRYGKDMRLTHGEGDPLIEFYDADADPDSFDPLGQLVARYYASTLFGTDFGPEFGMGEGLDLAGYEPAWTLDADTCIAIAHWIKGRLRHDEGEDSFPDGYKIEP